MFTGIIEETGTIESMKKAGHSMALTIKCSKILEDVHLGDSIAVNGICLTVTDFTKNQFTVDVMPETVKATSLNDLTKGSKVNLERAMAANGRFGGHFVSGHVDGTAEITRIEEKSNAVYYDLKLDSVINKNIGFKGINYCGWRELNHIRPDRRHSDDLLNTAYNQRNDLFRKNDRL